MNIDAVTIRPMTAEDLDAVAQIRSIGFGRDKDRTLASLQTDPRYDLSHIIVADYEGQVVGTATTFPVSLWLSGVPMNVGAVAGVAVLPQFRRKGIAAKMMETTIRRSFDDGYALSALFPFSHQYYGQFGYRTVSDLHAYYIDRQNLNFFSGEAGQVRPFAPNDLRVMRVMYKGQLTWHNGWLTRSEAWWDKLIGSWPNLMVFDNDGMIEGYCAYEIKVNEHDEIVLKIKEFFATAGTAYQGLLSFLAHQTEAEVIEYLAPADTLLRHSLHQPIAHHAQNHGWIFNDLCYVTPGPMARIINLVKALTSRFYTRGISGERVIKVSDPLIPENETPLVFRLVDGRAETRPADSGKPQIETDVATLSQIICGYMKAIDANRLGLLKANEETCSWLDRITADAPLFIQAGDWF